MEDVAPGIASRFASVRARRRWGLLAASLALAAGLSAAAPVSAPPSPPRRLITATIDEHALVRLTGNTRPEARAQNDLGRVPDTLPLDHMLLLLRRPPERDAALEAEIARLHDRRSTHFHHWLSTPELAERYGLARQDVAIVVGWLRAHGFTVNTVYGNTLLIDFSGSAGALREAFHTEIHQLQVHGQRHIANASDPQIPAALAPAVVGIVSLNDFRPRPQFKRRPAYTVSSSEHLVVPADLATIYNFNPEFSAGVSGQGQSIVVLEDTNVYSAGNWTTFRNTFLGSAYPQGSFTQEHPKPASGSNNCSNPGTVAGNELEATLDAEWASAAAPSASIVLASCADTTTTFGGLIALENLLDGSSPPAIVSLSYLECEAANGATNNAAYYTAYQQAVSLGTSVFVAAGESGAADCDDGADHATHGIGVNAFASPPYDVAAGGTDFGDTFAGSTASYWGTTNGATYGSALSYIPEIPWNDSCAGALLSSYEGYAAPYGSSGFCNSSAGSNFINTSGGAGGPSGCATGAPASNGVVGGSCQGYAKPTWQLEVAGNPSDGVRDLPDVSLFAANGLWGHYYVMCDSDAADGLTCSGAPSAWSGAGGTSFVAPILAGVQALINQSAGGKQGNPNPVYYGLAAAQSASGLGCNSSSGNAAAAGCIFYDVTQGDMDVDCEGTTNCYLPSGTYGVLSTRDTADLSAFAAASGWDFATGIGTVNVANLVKNWSSATAAANLIMSGAVTYDSGNEVFTLQLSNAGPQTATSVVVTAQVPAGDVLVTGASSAGCSQSGTTVRCSVANLSLNASAALTVALAPAPGTADKVTFNVAASQTDLDSALESVSLSPPGVTDGPMPPWSLCLLALTLLGLVDRRLTPRP